MVRDLVILRSDSASLVASSADSNLPFPIRGSRAISCVSCLICDSRGEHPHREVSIVMLRALRLAAYFDPRGSMTDTDRGVRLVAVLTTCARAPHRLDVDIFRLDCLLDVSRLIEHGHGDRARLDTPTLLRLGHALPPMTTSLVGEKRGSAPTRHAEHRNTGSLFYELRVKETSGRRDVGRSSPALARATSRLSRPRQHGSRPQQIRVTCS